MNCLQARKLKFEIKIKRSKEKTNFFQSYYLRCDVKHNISVIKIIRLIYDRANKLFLKFVATKQNHELIANEIKDYLIHSTNRNNSKYKTPFDCIPSLPILKI
ncbi:hypothetical protein BpHYR1_037664 [Brachionus plicatilis]|uniref:RNA-directed DNA polymerase from mobile element jockey-like n=1 Tax=Brachionus plicatilis TaxID=10195 RepID=A0A3M7P6F5_BRAPC|nr:hypothetical protein BpHYR1_037664 [Brachionus plicatilis]